MFKKAQQGFTLIELMIVVAIIGILAAIAIPAYQNYTIRAQVTEGLTLADSWKTAISEYYANQGAFPATAAALTGMNTATGGKYVNSITVTNGAITITYNGPQVNKAIATQTLGISPYLDANNNVIWVCGTASVPTLATGTPATVVTGTITANAQYLPTACHS